LDLATGENQREESRGKERLVAVEQSRSASKLGWPVPSNGATVTAWCGSSSAALRLGYPWRHGSSLARECMCVNVHGHTVANRCTRCRARPNGGGSARRGSTKVAHHAAGTPSCERRSTVGNGLPSGGLARKTEIWPGGGVHEPVCASDESRREQRPRWRGTARRHQRPSSPRVCVIKSPCPEKA
jgi:hypothetical protein